MDFDDSLNVSSSLPTLGDPFFTEYARDLLAYSGLMDATSMFATFSMLDDYAAQYLLPDFDVSLNSSSPETGSMSSMPDVSHDCLDIPMASDSTTWDATQLNSCVEPLGLEGFPTGLEDPPCAQNMHGSSNVSSVENSENSERHAVVLPDHYATFSPTVFDPAGPSSVAPSLLFHESTIHAFLTPSLPVPPPSPASDISTGSSYDSDLRELSPCCDAYSKLGRKTRFTPYARQPHSSESGGRDVKRIRKSAADRKEAPSRGVRAKQDGEQAVLLPPAGSKRCPICSFEQTNDRRPDLIRHVLTHYPKQHRCGGIPIKLAEALGLTGWTMETAQVWQGTMYVGGCLHGFSRRDALKRHLGRKKGCCFGDTYAAYQPPRVKRGTAGSENVAVIGWFGRLSAGGAML